MTGELDLRTVLSLLAGDARILIDSSGYRNSYNLVTRHGNVGGLWDELCRGGWIESMPNGCTFKLSDAGLLAYLRSTDEMGDGKLIAPTTTLAAVPTDG